MSTTLSVRENVYETNRYDEDGERILRWTYHVEAQDERGRRWMSNFIHPTWESAKSERRRLTKVGFDVTDADRWSETMPCYGSEAWGSEHEQILCDLDREPGGYYRW